MVKSKLLKEIQDKYKEEIYLKHNIINIPLIKEYETELFELGEYLPNLLRTFINPNYYKHMENLGVIDNVLEKMSETKYYSREENTIEFINWIDTHTRFEELLKEDEVKKMGDELEKLENSINKINKNISKQED